MILSTSAVHTNVSSVNRRSIRFSHELVSESLTNIAKHADANLTRDDRVHLASDAASGPRAHRVVDQAGWPA